MGFIPPEPRAEVFCVRLNFNIAKLAYCNYFVIIVNSSPGCSDIGTFLSDGRSTMKASQLGLWKMNPNIISDSYQFPKRLWPITKQE